MGEPGVDEVGDVYDVAIIGYGPSGQVAAGLLGQAGLKVWVAERLPDVYEIPRAISMDHEVLRVLQQLGVLEAIAPYFEPFMPSEYFGVDGQLIRRMTMVAPPYPQAHVPSVVFTQPAIERALRAAVAAVPNVTVALGTEVTQLQQDGAMVSLQARGADSTARSVQARYAIACDGGASGLRTQLGMALDDLGFDEPWLVVDVLVNDQGLAKLPATSVQYCEPERPCTLVIGPKNHRRWEISLNPGEDPKVAAEPERTWQLLSRWLSPEDGTLWRQTSYRFHALVAQSWRRGRVFLAGDAAHMQPPFLGQGMCQGIRDAANLSWKLISVLQGSLSSNTAERLLDSYGAERDAHVRELTTRIKAVGAVMCERDPAMARARDARLLAEAGGVVKDSPRQDILPPLSTGLLSAVAGPGRGSLFPQPWLQGAHGPLRMDERFGRGWRLVLGAGVQAPAVEAALTLVQLGTAQVIEKDGVAAAWLGRHQAAAALVRPDHYVFGCAADPSALAALLVEWRGTTQ